MDYRSTIFILTLWWWVQYPLLGQVTEDCRWEAGFWQEEIEAHLDEVQEGDVFFLAEGYLAAVARGRYDDIPSGLLQYEYLRPASEQELRRRAVEDHPREEVAPDGNIYVAKPAPGRAHFFRRGATFQGEMVPRWEDPHLVIPLGLEAVDIRDFGGTAFTLMEKAADYLRLDAGGQELYFFRGFPRFGVVFLTRQVQHRLADRQRRADRLMGRRWLMLPEAELASRSGQGISLRPHYLLKHAREVFIDSAKVTVDQLRLTTRVEEGDPVMTVEDGAPWVFFDRDCLAQAELDRLTADLAAEATLNEQLDALATQMAQDSVAEAEPSVQASLESRFRLDDQGNYRYVFEPAYMPAHTPYLRAWLDETGSLSLQSHYAAPQGLYHTRLILYTPDGDSLFTTRISTLDSRYVRTYRPEGIEEDIRFTEAEDLRLIEAIARYGDGPLRLRFTAGGDFFREITLSPLCRAQIRDTWLMYRLVENGDWVQRP